MLPDLPKLKAKLYKSQLKFFHSILHDEMGPFKECPLIRLFEGHMHGVERATGDREVNPLWPVSSYITLEPPANNTLESVFDKIYAMAKEMGENYVKKVLEYLKETLDEKGQTVDGKIEVIQNIESNSEEKARFETLFAEKEKKARAKEANRKLVG